MMKQATDRTINGVEGPPHIESSKQDNINNHHNDVPPSVSRTSSLVQERNRNRNARKSRENNDNRYGMYLYMAALHFLCFSIYFVPIFVVKSPHDRGQPVMDEMYIATLDHKDVYRRDQQQQQQQQCKLEAEKEEQADHHLHYPLVRIIPCWLQFWRYDSVWTNDYWGRPMNSESSHKSWRPLTVLSFRHLRFPQLGLHDLMSHRLVNVLVHTATGELVALLALLLLTPQFHAPPPTQQPRSRRYSFWLYTLTKLLFCLHPTHVEVTANAANRPHLIAVAATCLLANPYLPYHWFVLVMMIGFLSAETFLFGVVPAAATLLIVYYRQTFRYHQSLVQPPTTTEPPNARHPPNPIPSLWQQSFATLAYGFDRLLTLFLGSVLYYVGRSWMDWLNIPTGLIRPAENPYFRLVGRERLVNYAHVTALHVAKSWDLDWVGFSHEYGYQCLTPIESFDDVRLYIPLTLCMALLILPLIWFGLTGRSVSTKTMTTMEQKETVTAPQQQQQQQQQQQSNQSSPPSQQAKVYVWSTAFSLWLFYLSWLVTLFPIMGIVKVGTFVADRLVVTSSVSVCILVAHVFASWLSTCTSSSSFYCSTGSCRPAPFWRWLLVAGMLTMGWRRVYLRTHEWMDSYPLLRSSLSTCPRSAKSHLEISKIYSGLYPEYLDLKQARWHLDQVEKIDSTYCDVHFQYVLLAMQEQEFLEVEDRLMKAIPCPFTMLQATEMWQRYWEIMLNNPKGVSNPKVLQLAQERYQHKRAAMQQIATEAYEKEQREMEEDVNSHFVMWRGK